MTAMSGKYREGTEKDRERTEKDRQREKAKLEVPSCLTGSLFFSLCRFKSFDVVLRGMNVDRRKICP